MHKEMHRVTVETFVRKEKKGIHWEPMGDAGMYVYRHARNMQGNPRGMHWEMHEGTTCVTKGKTYEETFSECTGNIAEHRRKQGGLQRAFRITKW